MDSNKREKIIKKAMRKLPYTWTLIIEEEVYGGNFQTNILFYTDDDFSREGFAKSLICYYLLGKPLQEHPWVYPLLKDDLPVADKKIYTTMYQVDLRNKEGFLSFYNIDRNAAREIITDYLRDEVNFDDNEIEKIITDLGLKGPTLTSKKGNNNATLWR